MQVTHPDDSPRRLYLTGREAAWYKEFVTSAPWLSYRVFKRLPVWGLSNPRGGRFTRRSRSG